MDIKRLKKKRRKMLAGFVFSNLLSSTEEKRGKVLEVILINYVWIPQLA